MAMFTHSVIYLYQVLDSLTVNISVRKFEDKLGKKLINPTQNNFDDGCRYDGFLNQ